VGRSAVGYLGVGCSTLELGSVVHDFDFLAGFLFSLLVTVLGWIGNIDTYECGETDIGALKHC
jgi:hypothetical protein